MSPGVRPTPGNRPNRFSGIVQLLLCQMGSDFEKVLYMCNFFLMPSRQGRMGQGRMGVATEIILGKYRVGQRRLWEEIYL